MGAQLTIVIDYGSLAEIQNRLKDAINGLGKEEISNLCTHIAYVDMSIPHIWDLEHCGGKVPCRSLWDSLGNRLAAVLVVGNGVC